MLRENAITLWKNFYIYESGISLRNHEVLILDEDGPNRTTLTARVMSVYGFTTVVSNILWSVSSV